MTVDYNAFPNNKLNVDIVTSGSDPDKHCVIQITLWPVTPTPFGDKAYTSLIEPYREVSEELAGTDFEWALRRNGPIYRESNTLYGAWMDCIKYLTDLYCCPKDVRAVNRSGHSDPVFYEFLLNMCRDYYKHRHKKMADSDWPFFYNINNEY